MSNPFFVYTNRELLYLLVIFVLGIILGATFLNIFISQKIDKLILKKKELETKYQEQEKQIKQLEKNLKKQKQHFIQSLAVKLKTDLNKHTQQEIIKKIHKLLARIPGKEFKKVDPLLLRDIINNRYIMVENKSYHLKLIYLVIKEELELYIEVSTSTNNKEKNEP